LKRIRVARRGEAELEFQLPPCRQHGHRVDAQWQFEVQPRLKRVEKLPETQHHTHRLGSNRLVGRQKRRNQQDDQQAANEDGRNLPARWAAEIQIDDAVLVISHRK
jgi:hypothetical protein